ncbi:MAG TPA: cytochrome P450 [Nonomuraea sp.]|nr:cytochrome P450 [Nonomuraea sp.]
MKADSAASASTTWWASGVLSGSSSHWIIRPSEIAFWLERFLDGADAHGKAWMPFGGGRRFCVGAQPALLEMRVILREVLNRLELSAPNPAPEARRLKLVTLAPAKLTRVSARARTPARTP